MKSTANQVTKETAKVQIDIKVLISKLQSFKNEKSRKSPDLH
ncbi:hypothetical protein [Kurthia senegalensis]|nr:hypothetical protein [Kurthia senegalensis]